MRPEKQIKHRIAALHREIKACQQSTRATILDQQIDRKRQEIKGLEFALGLEPHQQTWGYLHKPLTVGAGDGN